MEIKCGAWAQPKVKDVHGVPYLEPRPSGVGGWGHVPSGSTAIFLSPGAGLSAHSE